MPASQTFDKRFSISIIIINHSNATIHQIDENVCIKDLDILTEIYQQLLNNLFVDSLTAP